VGLFLKKEKHIRDGFSLGIFLNSSRKKGRCTMFTVGDFYLYRNPLGQPRYIAVTIQKKSMIPSKKEVRTLVLAGDSEDIFDLNFCITRGTIEEQEQLIAYIKQMHASGSEEHFDKKRFARIEHGTQKTTPTCARLDMKRCTPIRSLEDLEEALQDFLPMQEYQHASVIRFFKSIHMEFKSTQPPNLSL